MKQHFVAVLAIVLASTLVSLGNAPIKASVASPQNGGNSVRVVNKSNAQVEFKLQRADHMKEVDLVLSSGASSQYFPHNAHATEDIYAELSGSANVLYGQKGSAARFYSNDFPNGKIIAILSGNTTDSVTVDGATSLDKEYKTVYTISWSWFSSPQVVYDGSKSYSPTGWQFTIESSKFNFNSGGQ